MNTRCGLFFNGNKPTSKLSESQSVFLRARIDGHSLHGWWSNWGDCRDSIPHPPIPKLLPGVIDTVAVGGGYLGFFGFSDVFRYQQKHLIN